MFSSDFCPILFYLEAFTVFISTLGSFFWDIATKGHLEHTFCARTHRLQGLAEPARAREAGE